jgi:hypothetical protein
MLRPWRARCKTSFFVIDEMETLFTRKTEKIPISRVNCWVRNVISKPGRQPKEHIVSEHDTNSIQLTKSLPYSFQLSYHIQLQKPCIRGKD